MTPTDCLDVVEFLAARCPAMRMHENTPEAWYLDLVEHTRADAMEAVRRCSLNSAFVGVGELVAECRRIRDRRIGAEKVAARQAEIEAENHGEVIERAQPLRALMAGTPIKSAPRPDWNTRRALPPRPAKPPFTDAELEVARDALRRRAEPATPEGATAAPATP